MNLNAVQRAAGFRMIRAGRAFLAGAEAFLRGNDPPVSPPPSATPVDDEIAQHKARKLLASAGVVPRQP